MEVMKDPVAARKVIHNRPAVFLTSKCREESKMLRRGEFFAPQVQKIELFGGF